MSIAGDRMYPTLQAADTDDHERPLQLLARAISFADPISGEARQFASARALASIQDVVRLTPRGVPPAHR